MPQPARFRRSSFSIPDFSAITERIDHPSSADMRTSQTFINRIVHSFIRSSSWNNGALFINYDEWGGFFDHVTPPRVPDDRGARTSTRTSGSSASSSMSRVSLRTA